MFIVAMPTRVLRPPFSGLLSGLFEPTLSALFRFDTYRSKKESERLVQYLNAVPAGRILSVAVNDEGSRNLDDAARKAMTKLGSKHFLHLGFRYPWAVRERTLEPRASPGRLHSLAQGISARPVNWLCLEPGEALLAPSPAWGSVELKGGAPLSSNSHRPEDHNLPTS